MKASRRIEDHDVAVICFRMRRCIRGNLHRILASFFKEAGYFHFFRIDPELFHCCRPVNIAGCKDRPSAFFLEFSRNLRRSRRLTGTLETRHHIDRKFIGGKEFQLRRLRSHEVDHLLIDDLDDHLTRIQAVHHILSDGALRHGIRELLHDLEIDVRLEKRHLDLFQRLFDVRFGQESFAPEIFKYILQFIR